MNSELFKGHSEKVSFRGTFKSVMSWGVTDNWTEFQRVGAATLKAPSLMVKPVSEERRVRDVVC